MHKYYIKESAWKKMYSYLKKIKGIRVSNEDRTRMFIEAPVTVLQNRNAVA
jgi:uncharacterized protein HemY